MWLRLLAAIIDVDVDLADRRDHMFDADQAIAVAIRVRRADVQVASVVLVVVGHVGVQFEAARAG